MAGRPPKPTPILKMAGTFRADRRPNQEPHKIDQTVPMPSHLKGMAKREWNRIVPLMQAAGTYSACDRAAIAAYCLSYGRWYNAEQEIASKGSRGEISTTSNGNEIQNPWLAIANRAAADMHRWSVELGLTPSARTRVDTRKAGGLNADEARFFGRGAL